MFVNTTLTWHIDIKSRETSALCPVGWQSFSSTCRHALCHAATLTVPIPTHASQSSMVFFLHVGKVLAWWFGTWVVVVDHAAQKAAAIRTVTQGCAATWCNVGLSSFHTQSFFPPSHGSSAFATALLASAHALVHTAARAVVCPTNEMVLVDVQTRARAVVGTNIFFQFCIFSRKAKIFITFLQNVKWFKIVFLDAKYRDLRQRALPLAPPKFFQLCKNSAKETNTLNRSTK